MEKIKINVEYKVDKTTYVTNQLSTEHFDLEVKAATNHVKIVIKDK